ncbi:hypothetical protein [Naumannella halotolerans]|uniref:DUF7822 domain-containing protein n=1 Tax=Naumannella halotolerans TaxID=993414 RepID=A0A4R7J2A0_9ACTN|nr:hypothetical protein [Naumannella halotolerans]TDT31204.1 hypothetical protein CLV29_2618 [Naumannella halotolerans]
MANRSYLYAVSAVPSTPGAPGRARSVSEWNWEIPAFHLVLMTGSPRLCPSRVFDVEGEPAAALVADFATGVANFRRYLAALPQTEEVRRDAADALAALEQIAADQPSHLLLETAEIAALVLDDLEGEELAAALQLEAEVVRREIGEIDRWLRSAPTVEVSEEERPAHTGGGHWPSVLYYQLPSEPPGGTSTPATDPTGPSPTGTDPTGTYAPDTTPTTNPTGTSTPAGPTVPSPTGTPRPGPDYRPGAGSAPGAPVGVGHPGPPTQPGPAAAHPPGAPAATQLTPINTPTGELSWALGLVTLIFIPFLSSILAGLGMVLAGRGQRRYGGTAAANGRNAANWGLTYLLLTVLLIGGHFVLLAVLSRDAPIQDFYPMGIPITVWLVVTLAHLVISILGWVRAHQHRVLWVPAIPFLR